MIERDFAESTLWRVSAYERQRSEQGHSGFTRLPDSSLLSMSMNVELSQLERVQRADDLLEIVAACMRLGENALIVVRHDGLVWPLTLFPQRGLYHLPRSIIGSLHHGSRDIDVLAVEPPGLRPPGYSAVDDASEGPAYRRLPPLLWALALHVPVARLLRGIAGHAAYRIAADLGDEGALTGALKPSFQRLRSQIAPQREIAAWPGMDCARAVRLLNGAYLQGGLIVLRSHQAARDELDSRSGIFDRLRGRR
jgi:hypothetical protein